MSAHWQNIMSSPEFQAMTPEEKQTTRDVFFDEVIAKQEQDPEVLSEARNYFNEQYNFIPKTEEPKTTATGAFLKAAKHEAGAGILGGLGAALGAAGMGAITGAEAGSVVPGWGNLAGAVIGGLVGGFGGKKLQQAVQGEEAYKQEARELEQLSQEHPIATSTGGLLPVIPTMMLNPGAGAATRLAGIGDEVSNIAAQAIRKNAPELTDDAINAAANSFRLMKPADAVNYAKSLGLGDEAVQAVQNAATKTVPRYVGQGLESGVQMGVASGASSAAQVAEGSKDFSDIPADILKGAVTGAPLGLVSPVRFGKGRLGAGLGGALVKGPLDAALMATGEEAYDAATGHSDGFDLQRTGERALGMLPSFSLLAGGMGVFHGVPGKLKEPAKPGQPELPYDQLPPVAEEIKIKEHEAIQNYIKAKASGDSDEITRAQEALIDARKAATPEPSILEKAAKQAEPVASPVLVEALKQADANIEAQKIEQAAKTQEVENAQVTDAETVLQGQPKGTEGRDTGLERMEPSPINQETKEPEPQEFRQEEAVTPVEPTSPPVERPLSRGETELLPEAPHEDRPAAVADTISPSIVESNADFTTKEPIAQFVHTTQTEPGKGQRSGYYPGTYSYEHESGFLPSMEGKRFIGEMPESLIYSLTDSVALKNEAAKAGFGYHSGNGNSEIEYLKSKGFKALRRGSLGGGELIVFDPKDANFQFLDELPSFKREKKTQPAPIQSVEQKGEIGSKFNPNLELTGKPPSLPDHPSGRSVKDILTFLNEYPLRKAGSSKAGEHDGLRGEDIPSYWSKFIFSKYGRGYAPDELAQMAFEEGHIKEPSVNALVDEINSAIKGRQMYRAQIVRGKAAEREQLDQHKRFNTDKSSGDIPVESYSLNVGDELVINGNKLKVTKVNYTEDGAHTTDVVLEDGAAYGIQHVDANEVILVDQFKPAPQSPPTDFLPPEANEPSFNLELVSQDQLKSEQQSAKQKDELRQLQDGRLTGDAGDIGTPDMFDTTAGETPLFDQPTKKNISGSASPEPSLKSSEQVNNIPDEIVAARKSLEDSTKEYDEWHKPIPITEADPARIDEIMAKRTETSSRLEAAKANLRFNIIKHETRNLPPEQRTRQMEGIKDEDADLIKDHKRAVEDAIAQRKPVSLEAAKEYGVKLDQDYQADAFGIARPTLDSRIRPFKEYAARAGRTEEKVSSNQVNEAIKLLPRALQKMLKKSGVVILTKEEAMRIPGAAEFVEKYSPEGFFYNGKIHVIPENIVVTTNDVNPVKAAARVLIHENFHEAFNAITAKDPVAKAEWESILKRIPENDLEALAKDYLKPENWRRNPDDVADLVNEWLPKKWEDYHLGKMAEAERPIFDRILESISKIIKRMFGNVRQFKTQDEDLEALFDRLTKNRLKITDEKANQEKLRLSTRGDDESESARARLRLRSEVARISQASLRSMGISDDMLAKFNIRILRDGEREREGFGPVSAGVTKDGRVAISFDFRNLDSQMPMGIKDSPQAREKFVKDAINEELIHLSDLIGFRNEWQKEGGVGSLNEFINKRSNIRFSIPTSPEAERERQFGKNLFGISMEAMRQQSKQFETGEMERVRLDYGEELFNRVRRAMDKDPRLGERATDRVLSGEGGLPTQDEQVAMALETAKLTNQLNTLGDLLDSPGMPTSEYSDILNRIDAIKGNMNRTMQAIYQSGTALSRAFYARQLAFNNKYELQNIYQRARRAKGGVELSKEEYEHIFNQTRRIIKDTDALDRLEREKDKLRVTDLIDLVAKQVDEIKNSGGKIGDEGKIVLKETPPPSKEQAAIDVTEEVINDVSQKAVGKLDSIFGRFSSIFSAIKKRGLKIAEKFGFKPSLAEDEFSKLSDDELLKLADEASKDLNQAIKNVQAVLGINEPKTGDNQTKAKSVLDEARKKIEQLKEPLIKDKKPRPKTKLQELLKEHHDLRMSADEFLKKAEDIGLDGKTATELYENYNNRKGAYAQELPDSVFTRLLRKFVEEGERDTNQIAVKISQWLGKSGYGDISPEDVMARVSRYGKKTFPSQEEVDKISRQKTAEMLVLSQINDIEENLRAPQLTGAQRDKAHAELRELMKRRNDIMNELDIHRVSPEQQFANARDRSIRALENRKEELLRVLEGKAEYRQKTRKTRERDAEEQALYDEVQSLNKQVLELYKEDKPLTPEEWNAEREKRLNASINKLAERIKNKDFLPKEMTPVEKTQAVKDAEALLQQLREDFMEMRDAAHPELKIEAKQKAVTKALQNRLEALRKIEETGRETKEKSDLPDTPEMKAIREAIKELSQKIKIKEWPEKRMESLQKALDRADKAIEGNLPGVKTPKFEHLKTAEIREAEELLRNKRYTRTLQAQLRKWNEKLASGDFTHKKKSVRVLDEQQRAIKSRIDKVKDDIDKAVKELEYNQLSPLEKAGEWAVRLKRFNILSSPISVFKLSSAAMIRAGTMSMENFMKTPLDILYPEIAKYGSLEAGSSSKELGKAIATAWSKGMKDSYETLQKGKSELDRLYGDGSLEKEGWTNFFGRMHGMLKAPVKRAAFELAMTRQIEAFRREKGYIPSEAEQLPLAMRAYAWANRQIFMNDNAITSAWNSALNTFDQKGWRGASNLARFLLPIVKVPTNIAIETAQYTPMGLAKGTYDMIKVVRAGIDSIKDKPEMVESIQRNFRKGAIGTGLMLLGYALPQIAGGFYEKGEKRHKDEADFGELMINGVRVPKWMIHAPFFEVIQLGSTMRRAIDHSLEKHGEREYSEGVIAGLKGVADELPFISEMGRVSDAMDNAKSRNRFLGDLVASSVVPAAVGYVARKTDTEAPDDASIFEKLNAPTVKRETVADSFPKTARQSIQAQIPGLRERLVPRSTTPFGPGIAIPSAISLYEKSGHPMPSLPLRSEFETRYGKVSDDRWLSYVAARGNMLRREMMDKMHQLNEMDEADKRKAVQQITKHASSSARKMIGLE